MTLSGSTGGRDPVHLSPVGYLKMTENICNMAKQEEQYSNPKGARDKPAPSKRWLTDNDRTAYRRLPPNRRNSGGPGEGSGRRRGPTRCSRGSYGNPGGRQRGGGDLRGKWNRGFRGYRKKPY